MHTSAVLTCLTDLYLQRWQETGIKLLMLINISRNRSAKSLCQKRNYVFFVFVTCRNHWHGTRVAFCNLCKGHGLHSSNWKFNIFPLMPAKYWIFWRFNKCQNLYESLFRKCITLSNGEVLKFWQIWIITKEAYHESNGWRSIFWERTPLRLACTKLGLLSTCQTWFRQKYPMLPDKVRFRFVFAKCVFGCMCDISHFVTHEATSKPVQTLLLTQKLQNLCWFGQHHLKVLFEKISYWENVFKKDFLSLLKTNWKMA